MSALRILHTDRTIHIDSGPHEDGSQADIRVPDNKGLALCPHKHFSTSTTASTGDEEKSKDGRILRTFIPHSEHVGTLVSLGLLLTP